MRRLRIGFVPLVDAASVIVAAKKGFAEAEGFEIALSRERSWASVRDKLSVGYLDAAHVLSPMVVASRLSLGNFRSPLFAPMMLSVDGNEVTLSAELASLCAGRLGYMPEEPTAWGQALAKVVREGIEAGAPPFAFASVFPFSSHSYLLRDWLAGADIDPDRDVNATVLPPPLMADALAEGSIDGFCAGPPWGRLAEERGAGRVAFRAVRLQTGVPEKALALRQNDPMRDANTIPRLVRAVFAAAQWCADPENADELFTILAAPDAVGVDGETIRSAIDRSGMRIAGADTLRPDLERVSWIAERMVRWKQAKAVEAERVEEATRSSFRPDLFDSAFEPDEHR